jgi:antitoxin (DNA-binding transcriptional repressor) of toxin-antitoxin stability system
MATYSIEEAKKLLSELIDKALAGEDARIARDGEPVVHLRAAPQTARGRSSQFIKGMAARAKLRRRPGEPAVDITRRMREERELSILSAMRGYRAPMFSCYVGVDYSGAETPEQGLPGIRAFVAEDDEVPPIEVPRRQGQGNIGLEARLPNG